jgi:Flp pilus assembly protein TadD
MVLMVSLLGPSTAIHAPMQTRRLFTGLALAVCIQNGLAQIRPACHGPDRLESEVRAHPTAKTWAALAGWFGEQHQYACAIPAFQSALRVAPGSASLHYYLGLKLQSSGQSNDAITELERSIELDPSQLQPRLLLGVSLSKAARGDDAEEAWEGALRVDPNSVAALDWLAKALVANGQSENAVDLLKGAPPDEEFAALFAWRLAMPTRPTTWARSWVNKGVTPKRRCASGPQFQQTRALQLPGSTWPPHLPANPNSTMRGSALRIKSQNADALRLQQMLARAAARPPSNSPSSGESAAKVPQ